MAEETCEHSFQYAGVRYRDGNQKKPGSGACYRYYAHVYFCSKCLKTRAEPKWYEGTTYDGVSHGATPASPDLIPLDRYE